MKMHKLVEPSATTVCNAWLRDNDGFYASRWWKYVTCKLCLRKRGQ